MEMWLPPSGGGRQPLRADMHTRRTVFSLVCRQLQVVEIRPELRVDEESGRSLVIAHRVDLLDRPGRRLRLADRPGLATGAHLAVRHVLDAEFEVVPRVGLPFEWRLHGPHDLRLPRLDLELLRVAVEHERVALSG